MSSDSTKRVNTLLVDPEAQAALSRIKREAELTVERLAESASGGAR